MVIQGSREMDTHQLSAFAIDDVVEVCGELREHSQKQCATVSIVG